jgi:hypothetical protein
MEEVWKAVVGWDYEVSSLGRVRYGPNHWKAGTILPPIKEYVRVTLRHEGKTKKCSVHSLVAAAFMEPSNDGSTKLDHKDGDKTNNAADNLEWVTPNQNQLRAFDLGLQQRGAGHGRAKLTDDKVREIRRRYQGQWGEQTKLAKEFGVSQMLIAKIVRGEIWTHLDPDYKPKVCLAEHLAQGKNHGAAKLTPRSVRAMRRAFTDGVSIENIAKRFSVARQIARDVVYGKTWKSVQ